MTPGLKKQLSELDGLIITEIPPETLEFITTLNKKIVFVDNYIDGYCNIGYNTVYANQLIFDHIIKCGYKRSPTSAALPTHPPHPTSTPAAA
ncbi:hypothetical protein M5E84_10600 [[Ruminococcus] torques]|nr:hypothetical protein M5E84_10600 [[Ruminococcus] torques]